MLSAALSSSSSSGSSSNVLSYSILVLSAGDCSSNYSWLSITSYKFLFKSGFCWCGTSCSWTIRFALTFWVEPVCIFPELSCCWDRIPCDMICAFWAARRSSTWLRSLKVTFPNLIVSNSATMRLKSLWQYMRTCVACFKYIEISRWHLVSLSKNMKYIFLVSFWTSRFKMLPWSSISTVLLYKDTLRGFPTKMSRRGEEWVTGKWPNLWVLDLLEYIGELRLWSMGWRWRGIEVWRRWNFRREESISVGWDGILMSSCALLVFIMLFPSVSASGVTAECLFAPNGVIALVATFQFEAVLFWIACLYPISGISVGEIAIFYEVLLCES